MSFSLLLEITLTVTLNFIWPPEWSDGTGSAQQSNNVRRSDNHGGKLCQKVIPFSCSCFFVYLLHIKVFLFSSHFILKVMGAMRRSVLLYYN